MIVKADWLGFLEVSAKDRQRLAELILKGDVRDALDLPKGLRARLNEEALAFVLEKSAQVQGQPSRLLQSLKAFTPERVDGLAGERLFLKAFALSRLGRVIEAEALFTFLPPPFLARIETERALHKLNKGDFVAACALFKIASLRDTGLDPFSHCTLLGGWALALIHQGEFRAATRSLNLRRKVLKAWPSPVLGFGTHLYEILLLLEQNAFDAAEAVLYRSLEEQTADSVNRYFLLHLQLRLHLARNELAESGLLVAKLAALARELKLSEGVLDFRLERTEWQLRSGKVEEAGAGIAAIHSEERAQADRFLAFRLGLLRAQTLHQQGQTEKALAEIKQVLLIGESGLYRPALTWAFFHAAGMALAAGHPMQARLYLNRGRVLATTLGLRVRQAAFNFVCERLDNKYARASALVSLARHPEIGVELEYLLDSYRLLEDLSFVVAGHEGRERIAEPTLRRMLFRSPGVFWFQREMVLITNHREFQVAACEFSLASPLLTAFRLFWAEARAGGSGLTLEQVHKTRVPHAFREELHASAAKMVISRLREQLKPCALTIRFDREGQRYSLISELPSFTIQSLDASVDSPPLKKDREREILERVAMEPFVSTRKLCAEFGVSRQALHPFLNALVKADKIRVVKRGPRSGYILRALNP